MDRAVKVASFTVLVEIVSCSIIGLSYMDSLNLVPSAKAQRGEDPCKPLYWYPRQIPDYCYLPKLNLAPPENPVPEPTTTPPPMPLRQLLLPVLPMPLFPQPMPLPMPMSLPLPGPPPMPPPLPGPIPFPAYGAPAPFPVGPPGYPVPLLPGQALPAMQTGLVPGVDGLVSSAGTINTLPFSDAYSDLLEKHKQKMIRRRLQYLLDEYEYYPKKRRSHRWHIH